eukprot:TRINITY_DN40532_c0_g1_i1.p1 TRINITY_DN40532_c0_g1~~TRINITY_DN40532_c0_g1_i1.p1  ORF type:complete len:154 (-),score=15.52 TRINITY_DN40532_c0_g1_i1:212-673(-)
MDRLFGIIVLSAMVMESVSYRIRESVTLEEAEEHNASTQKRNVLQTAEKYGATTNSTQCTLYYLNKAVGWKWLGGKCGCAYNYEDTDKGQHKLGGIDTDEECLKACAYDSQCQAFEFKVQTKRCYMFFNTNVNSLKYYTAEPYVCFWKQEYLG